MIPGAMVRQSYGDSHAASRLPHSCRRRIDDLARAQAGAQAVEKVYRLGSLTPGAPLGRQSRRSARCCSRHWNSAASRVGKNLTYDARAAGGQVAKLPELVRGHQGRAASTRSWRSAIRRRWRARSPTSRRSSPSASATRWRPSSIEGLARPGGNVTGISDNATTLSTKRMALIKQAVSEDAAVSQCCGTGEDLGMSLRYEASADAARALGVNRACELGVREPDDFNGVFEAMNKREAGCHPDGVRRAHHH